MKKVLFVATITKHIIGFHTPYLKWFKEQGYEVHVASNGNEKIEYCDKHFDIPFERFPIKVNNLRAYKQLKNVIDENKYTIIHCHTPVGGVLTRLAARDSRKNNKTKVMYTAHGFHFYKGAPILNWIIYYPIEKICARWTDCLITINQEDYKLAKRQFRIQKIKLIHGVGVDENKFNIKVDKKRKIEIRHKLGLNEDDFVISYVAELNNNKNQGMLIEVIKELNNNKIKLLLVGTGVLKSEYIKKIYQYKLEKNILLLGYRKDIPEILKISDLYISVSKREGLPLNIIEARIAKLPVIATDIRGHRELMKSEDLIKIDNKNDLKQKIEKVLINKPKIQPIDSRYCLESVLKEMEKLYLEEIKESDYKW